MAGGRYFIWSGGTLLHPIKPPISDNLVAQNCAAKIQHDERRDFDTLIPPVIPAFQPSLCRGDMSGLVNNHLLS
jgi:hypothetical protein